MIVRRGFVNCSILLCLCGFRFAGLFLGWRACWLGFAVGILEFWYLLLVCLCKFGGGFMWGAF